MKLVIRLFGPFLATWTDRQGMGIAGVKQQALLALLAAAPEFARSRSWLVATLWPNADMTQGRRNLRQLLHGLRTAMGERFERVVGSEGDLLFLHRDRIVITGAPDRGEFLEGFDLNEEGFEDWLRDMRQGEAGQLAPRTRSDGSGTGGLHPRVVVTPLRDIGLEDAGGLGDAMAHQLCIAFARTGLIDAISHLSGRTMLEIGAAEADFRLSGQYRRQGGKLVADVALEDLRTGAILWGDRFETDRPERLAGDPDLATEIAGQCLWQVGAWSCRTATIQPLGSIATHALLMNGIVRMHGFESGGFFEAGAMLEEVVARCPDHSIPLAWLSQWHLLAAYQGWCEDTAVARRGAGAAIERALDLNPCCELSLAIDGNIRNAIDGDFAVAAQRFAAARDINPSSAMISQLYAVLCCFLGRGDEAVAMTERARRLAPSDPRRSFFAGIGASSYLAAGRWDEAVAMAEEALIRNPGHISAQRCRVIGLQRAGRDREARQAARELARLCPGLTVSGYLRAHPAGDMPIGRDWADALKSAGIPVN